MKTEKCENCGRTFGKLETPQIWNERVVCASCAARLRIAPPSTKTKQLVHPAVTKGFLESLGWIPILCLFAASLFFAGRAFRSSQNSSNVGRTAPLAQMQIPTSENAPSVPATEPSAVVDPPAPHPKAEAHVPDPLSSALLRQLKITVGENDRGYFVMVWNSSRYDAVDVQIGLSSQKYPDYHDQLSVPQILSHETRELIMPIPRANTSGATIPASNISASVTHAERDVK